MKKYKYQTHGTCSRQILFAIDDDGRLRDVKFIGGCNGNLQGISRLVEGMKASEAEERLAGILCGDKPTSCPDQLARAIHQALTRTI